MRLDPHLIKSQIARLLVLYPELADDEQFRADMIEAETEALPAMQSLVRTIGDVKSKREALDTYIDELAARGTRLHQRELACRALILAIMQAGQLRKVELPDATLSVRTNPPKLVGSADVKSLPDHLCRITREENRSAIKAELQAGNHVDGYSLSNAEPSLMIRIS